LAGVVSNSRVCNEQQSSFGIKVLPFMANYSRKLRIRVDIRRKGKVEKAIEFVKRMKKVQEEGTGGS